MAGSVDCVFRTEERVMVEEVSGSAASAARPISMHKSLTWDIWSDTSVWSIARIDSASDTSRVDRQTNRLSLGHHTAPVLTDGGLLGGLWTRCGRPWWSAVCRSHVADIVRSLRFGHGEAVSKVRAKSCAHLLTMGSELRIAILPCATTTTRPLMDARILRIAVSFSETFLSS